MKFNENAPNLPDDKICPHIAALSRYLRRDVKNTLADNGLFCGQDRILFTVDHFEGISPSALAQRMNLSSATVSVSIKRLEKAGFIEKKADEKDARLVHLYLTKKAKELSDTIFGRMNEQEDIVTKNFTNEEKTEFMRLLKKSLENLEQEGANKN